MKKIFLFAGGFLSCSIIVILLMSLNIYPFNNDENSKERTEEENIAEKPEYIFTVEKYEGGDAAEYDNIDLTKQDTDEYKIDTSNITYSDETGEPKINYTVWINGIEKDIKAIQHDKETYINLRELKEALNNLDVSVHDEEKILNIYEKTGLGIINNNGKQYIEIGNFTSRYSVPFDRLPYFYLMDHKTFLESDTHQGVAEAFRMYPKIVPLPPDIKPEFPEYVFFDTAIVTREYFIEKLPVFLKILSANELYIEEHPGALYRSY